MARTQLSTREIGNVQRNDVDTTTTGEALIRRLIAGSNVSFSSTGVDTGTGDVTVNVGTSGNFQLGSSTNITSAYQTGSISFHADTTQNAIRFTPQGAEGSYWKTFESGSGTSTILNFQFVPRASGAVYNGTTAFDSWGSPMSFGISGTPIIRLAGAGYVGIGHPNFTNISSPLDIMSTTPQVKVRYDLNNYLGITVGSNGSTIFGIATPSGSPTFTFERQIRSSMTGGGAIGLDFAVSDTYANMRVIRNATSSVDHHLYLNYDAGDPSQIKMYSAGLEVLTVGNGANVTVTGNLDFTGNLTSTSGSITLTNGDLNLLVGQVSAGGFSAPTGSISIANSAYGSGWNGDNTAPTRNDVYDKIQTFLESVALTDGSTVTINTTLGKTYHHSGTVGRTFALSGTPENGKSFILILINTGGSPITHTFTGASGSWRYGTDVTAVSTVAAGKTNYLTFVKHPTQNFYDIVAEVKGY